METVMKPPVQTIETIETEMIETEMIETETIVPTVTVTLSAPTSTPTLVAAFATTPKRGAARKMPKEPATLYAYAVEQGGRVALTPATKAELVARGLPEHRIGNAAYGIRKCFGKTVTTERTGRAVSAYLIAL